MVHVETCNEGLKKWNEVQKHYTITQISRGCTVPEAQFFQPLFTINHLNSNSTAVWLYMPANHQLKIILLVYDIPVYDNNL